ncbi:type I-B CRISPR-associated protein Cas8b1/Cst1 [Ruminococcus sp. Marseille-P6503]|uniref:type I-B CRISPR-associated protein Cas8b1/Cst1 n=1 Tax=Ruminococcus sp. Marseille-P6503 TaxID=2364796 RepID=UPI0013DDF47D|nr:type I-B CRISPR-associated protein Cas8b1/Cst1 [Ruminococcus sp. Marseille-P6503]
MNFTVYLNDALFNAGMLGFHRILKNSKLDFKIVDYDGNESKNGTGLSFDDSIYENFAECYLEGLKYFLGKDAAFSKLVAFRDRLENLDKTNQDKFISAVADAKELVVKKMSSASYKSAYEIIRGRGESYDFLTSLARIKETKEPEKLRDEMIAAIDKMSEYKDVFIIKDIIYTQVQYYWGGISFLHKTQNKSEYVKAYEDTFVKPLRTYVKAVKEGKRRKVELSCCQCGCSLMGKDSFNMAWINNQGVDMNKKTSPYWNFKPDLVLCPVCSIIYSCIPLGFSAYKDEGYFINKNSSINDLESVNNFNLNDFDGNQGYYAVIRKFIDKKEQQAAENEIQNIQVLRRKGETLSRNILSKDVLAGIKECQGELENLINRSFKKNNEYLNLFDEALRRIMNHENMYGLMYDNSSYLFNENKTPVPVRTINGRSYSYLLSLSRIQIRIHRKGDINMAENLVDNGFRDGKSLRMAMIGPDRNENKIRSLSYRLINALKGRNKQIFLDCLMRQYQSEGKSMPADFCNVIKYEDRFLDYGYAFVSGLNSFNEKSEEEKTNE